MMTKPDQNYRIQKQTCQFCEHWDLLGDNEGNIAGVVCSLSKEPIDDNGICDFYSPEKDGK
jgi:hypothetical protein